MSEETKGNPWLTTPRAILLGAFVIGAFAYAGLRARSTPAAITATEATHRSAASIGATTASAQTFAGAPTVIPAEVAPSAAPVAARPAVEAAARKALSAHHPALKQACWKARPPEARVRLLMNLSFDRSGAQVVRGLSEPRLPEEQRAWIEGLGPCISEKLPPLSIDPPGASVQVEIPIDFP